MLRLNPKLARRRRHRRARGNGLIIHIRRGIWPWPLVTRRPTWHASRSLWILWLVQIKRIITRRLLVLRRARVRILLRSLGSLLWLLFIVSHCILSLLSQNWCLLYGLTEIESKPGTHLGYFIRRFSSIYTIHAFL